MESGVRSTTECACPYHTFHVIPADYRVKNKGEIIFELGAARNVVVVAVVVADALLYLPLSLFHFGVSEQHKFSISVWAISTGQADISRLLEDFHIRDNFRITVRNLFQLTLER